MGVRISTYDYDRNIHNIAISLNANYYTWDEYIQFLFVFKKKLGEWILKILIKDTKKCNYVMMIVNRTYCGDHLGIYTNTEPLQCVPETKIMLCQSYFYLKKKKQKKEKVCLP